MTLTKQTLALTTALVVAAAVATTLGMASKPPPGAALLSQWGVLAGVHDVDATLALRRAAHDGVVASRQVLGSVLVNRPDAESVQEGRQWLERAARANDAKAQLALGKLLFKGGPGVPVDCALALPLLKSAVASGLPGAAYYLGLIYKNGWPATPTSAGMPADMPSAAMWLQVAAVAGVADAQFLLGQMLLVGDGIPAHPAQARDWFEKAAEQEHPEANLQLLMARSRGEMGFENDEHATALQYMEAQHSLRHRPPAP